MPLDGAAETWWVKVSEKVYGPYTRDLMARYVAEGRVRPTSLVSLDKDGQWIEARHSPALQAALGETRGAFKTEPAEADTDLANLLVIIDISSGVTRRFEYELGQFGAVVEVKPGVFLLRTHKTAGVVRNALSQMLSRGDKLLIMDATRDRLAWFNLGPETDARIREVWNAPLTR